MSAFKRVLEKKLQIVFLVLCCLNVVRAQGMDCYGPGSIAGAVIGTFVVTLILIVVGYCGYKWFWKNRREKHLVLETDPEHGDKYAFDNPCFKDGTPGGLTPIGKALDKSGTRLLDTGKKWSQWSPLGALVSTKNEKKRTLDDSHLEVSEVKTVNLRSHDFTGLGFNICGNMRDGIYIKDVLHRGPASESGKLNPGDRINSVRISFEHMVYEDALTILSYASPYEVEVEAKSVPKGHHGPPGSGGQGAQPKHPLYRSSSSSDLVKIGKSARLRLFLTGENMDNSITTDYSTLPYSSNNTTLERGRKSPRSDVNSLTKPERTKKNQNSNKSLSPEQLKVQLEQNLSQKITPNAAGPEKIESEKQSTEADGTAKKGFQKFGVRVLPMDKEQNTSRSPKSAELSQNDNNINQERQENGLPDGVDEVDKTKMTNGVVIKEEAPPVKRREKIKNNDAIKNNDTVITEIKATDTFERQNSLNGSGIKRDKAGIPQEIPDHMFQAAVAARKNRKSQEVLVDESPEIEEIKTPKKLKGKAPAPPPVTLQDEFNLKTSVKLNLTDNLDEISTLQEDEKEIKKSVETDESSETIDEATIVNDTKEYCSDSDMETDNQSSVNTIELNSSDITIHHAEQNSEIKGRKTASTGDLSKIQKEKKSNTGTLERAQSLDITDSGIPTLNKKRKATKDDLDSKLSSDESLYENPGLKVKEPRLSLAMDGLDTFQRNRLKKSTEWGNLEDVILNLVDENAPKSTEISEIVDELDVLEVKNPMKFDFGNKDNIIFGNDIKNELWPALDDPNIPDDSITIDKVVIKPQVVDKKDKIIKIPEVNNISVQNIVWPENHQQTHSIQIASVDVSETKKPEDISENTEKHFSLKDTFQEKLISKLSETNKETTINEDNVSTIQTGYIKQNMENIVSHPGKSSQNFIFAEKYASNNDCYDFPKYDTNISDDIKVSRHSLGSLERPKSDVLKSVNKLKMQNLIASDQGGVSNITVTESKEDLLKKPETDINTTYDLSTASELYTTASDLTLTLQDEKPESDQYSEIKNITITETFSDSKYSESPSSLTIDTSSDGPDSIKSNTLTYVTEIQVTTPPKTSITDINPEAVPEETIKKLPEMKFTTSSYETPKTPEKRISQIELLRSNFEKSLSKSKTEISPSKSRIPVATKIDFKMSPERKEDEEIVEITSTNVHHSTPLVLHQKFTNIKSPNNNRNVTVTSIRTSSKIPSGASNYSNKPPVPARPDAEATHDARNGTESSFKQWVFNPSENSVTNIVVNNNKDSHK